jgi:hypothetical protein
MNDAASGREQPFSQRPQSPRELLALYLSATKIRERLLAAGPNYRERRRLFVEWRSLLGVAHSHEDIHPGDVASFDREIESYCSALKARVEALRDEGWDA